MKVWNGRPPCDILSLPQDVLSEAKKRVTGGCVERERKRARESAMTSKPKEPKEPSTAPPAEKWFPLTLGSTLRDPSPSSRFYNLRYEFKPASIDRTRPASLLKSADNKVTVEYCNNQGGKPISFQGNMEDCKELDAVIFFDGKSFRLERLHRSVKCLRHIRQPGESANLNNNASGMGTIGGSSVVEPTNSPGHQNGSGVGLVANVNVEKINPLVQVEAIIAGHTEKAIIVGHTETTGEKKANKRKADVPAAKTPKRRTPPRAESPREDKMNEVQVEVDNEIDEREQMPKAAVTSSQPEVKIDEEIVSDYEIEDVDVSDVDVSEDEEGVNAAEALRAQAAVSQKQESSSSGSGSGSGSSSGSSDSGSGSSSSSGSGSDDEEDSASSGDDII